MDGERRRRIWMRRVPQQHGQYARDEESTDRCRDDFQRTNATIVLFGVAIRRRFLVPRIRLAHINNSAAAAPRLVTNPMATMAYTAGMIAIRVSMV
jgi:hypothetical protein